MNPHSLFKTSAARFMLLSVFAAASSVSAQCNPLNSACDPVPALGGSLNTNFVNGASDRYVPIFAADKISYGSNGVDFQVSGPGNNPSIDSNFYLMFGRIEFEAQAAPGVGIVSSMVLISDDKDEIDIEWLGGDVTQVQSNYFSKGDTSVYNRGAFHELASPQTNFYTYAIDWTSERVIWYVNGAPVRTLPNPGTGYYPQSPMKIRFGSWAGGDSSNAPGTIEWAGGLTDYSAGPFNFYVRNLNVQDYSTGTAYKFNDQSGSWTSVEAINGKVNGNLDGSAPVQSQSVSSQLATVSSTESPVASSTEVSSSTFASSTEVSTTSEPISSSAPATSTEASTTSEPASSTEIFSTSEPISSSEPATSSVPASSTEISSTSSVVSSTEVSSTSSVASSTEVSSTSSVASSTSSVASEVSSTSSVVSSAEVSSTSLVISSTEVSSTLSIASSTVVSTTSEPVSSTHAIPTPEPLFPTTSKLISSTSKASSIVELTSTSTVIVHPTTSKPETTVKAVPTLSTVYNSTISQVHPTMSLPQVNGVAQHFSASFTTLFAFMIASVFVF
ncbi:hypothetical protein D0Z03_002307 [Geotrichum reessii]|nr:hypothetical protein D0Z03_002307 [Galactomyces reessii]